jgi:hypothetical protein
MSYLIAINAKDWEIKDKDKCQKSRDKHTKPNVCGLSSGANAEPAEGGLARLAIERLAGPAGVTQPNAAAEAPARARCRRIGD